MRAHARSPKHNADAEMIALLKAWASESLSVIDAQPELTATRQGATRVDATAVVRLLMDSKGGASDAPSALLMV